MALKLSQENKEILTKQLGVLPENVRRFVDESDITTICSEVGKTYQLTEAELIQIENEFVLVLLGLEPLDDLEQNLSETAIDANQAKSIAAELRTKLPQSVRDALTPSKDTSAEAAQTQTNQSETPAETPAAPQPSPAPKITDARQATESVQLDTAPAPKPSTNLASSRTMHSDIETIQKVGEPKQKEAEREGPEAENAVPRYARPLTDTPKYDQDGERNRNNR